MRTPPLPDASRSFCRRLEKGVRPPPVSQLSQRNLAASPPFTATLLGASSIRPTFPRLLLSKSVRLPFVKPRRKPRTAPIKFLLSVLVAIRPESSSTLHSSLLCVFFHHLRPVDVGAVAIFLVWSVFRPPPRAALIFLQRILRIAAPRVHPCERFRLRPRLQTFLPTSRLWLLPFLPAEEVVSGTEPSPEADWSLIPPPWQNVCPFSACSSKSPPSR